MSNFSSRTTRTVISSGSGGTRTQTTTTTYGGDGGGGGTRTVQVSGGGGGGSNNPSHHAGGVSVGAPSRTSCGGHTSSGFKPRSTGRRPPPADNRGWTGTQDWNTVMKEVQSTNQQWEDPEFPADNITVFYSQSSQRDFVWKRPHEITSNPQLFVGGASRFDVKQGALGDCWLLAATASLSIHKELLHQVIPPKQTIDERSCGAIRFRFWQFGDWIDVIVDTRLPTYQGQLVFMHSAEGNEFWSALLEKAYAKLFGSYESLKGGSSSEAMEDFTGGVTEFFDLRKGVPDNLFSIMQKACQLSSLMGCSIEARPNVVEAKLDNGLIMGHAYSVTGVQKINVHGRDVCLVRARNPWGNEAEWTGAWSDSSSEWRRVTDEQKEQLGLTFESDGEFWMDYQDFVTNFQRLEICNLGPDSLEDDCHLSGRKKSRWEATSHQCVWKKNASAGGCRNFINTFNTNPQIRVTVVDPDEDDDQDKGTLIVGLMQKGRRKLRAQGQDLRTIGYVIYQWKDGFGDPLPREFFERNVSKAKSPTFINLREVCGRHKLDPGDYVIVPSTFDANEEADFILRIFSEKPCAASEIDEETKMVEPVKDDRPEDDAQCKALKQAFEQVAGTDMEVDAYELQGILNHAFMKVFKFDGFSIETARSLVALLDVDQSGKLGCDEFIALWKNLNLWKSRFSSYDVDNSGTLKFEELRPCLKKLGFSLSNSTLRSTATRFARSDGTIEFDDFVLLAARLKTVFETFQAMDPHHRGTIEFGLDQFIMTCIYS